MKGDGVRCLSFLLATSLPPSFCKQSPCDVHGRPGCTDHRGGGERAGRSGVLPSRDSGLNQRDKWVCSDYEGGG